MKILVIGGNRFVGKKVAYELSKLTSVSVLNRSGTGPDKVKVIKWDRNEPLTIENDYNVNSNVNEPQFTGSEKSMKE